MNAWYHNCWDHGKIELLKAQCITWRPQILWVCRMLYMSHSIYVTCTLGKCLLNSFRSNLLPFFHKPRSVHIRKIKNCSWTKSIILKCDWWDQSLSISNVVSNANNLSTQSQLQFQFSVKGEWMSHHLLWTECLRICYLTSAFYLLFTTDFSLTVDMYMQVMYTHNVEPHSAHSQAFTQFMR